jgi:2,5-furandicarboxylate decarboxylase 1
MPIHDLRSYLAALEAAGQLARVRKPVSLDYELADVAAALERQGGPAPLFERVDTSGREVAVRPWPVFASAVANQTRAALALECAAGQVVETMGRGLDPENAIQPERVERAEWEDNVLTGDEVDVRTLPIPIHASGDGGPFITGGVTVSKDPVSGRGNLSYNRMQVKGPREFGFNLNEWRHVMQFLKNREQAEQALPVAIAIGLDPAISIAAGARYDGDELCIAGALRGQGVPVRRGLTVDVDIPAEAEIVIEGYLGAHERQGEGALAEFHGYFGEIWESPVFHVTAVCWRDDPIYQTIIPGWNEHVYIGNVLPREPLLLKFVRHVSKNVTALHIPPYSSGFSAIVAIDKANPGEPKNVALAAMTAHVNVKWVIVVDSDVDIYDPADVLWALNTRVDWSRDVFIIPGAQGHEMDPTADMRGVHAKIGIDATFDKGRRDYAGRVKYGAVDVSKYLG